MQADRTVDRDAAVTPLVERRERGALSMAFKRVFDTVATLSALVALSPLLIAIAAWIRLDSAGPAIFKQERLGRNMKPFTMYKFRSMRVDSDDSYHRDAVKRTAETSRSDDDSDIHKFKTLDDPRITRAGKFIRKWNLDELPNLFSILKGEMSLVGPRPALEYELAYYKDWYYERFGMRPGLTGLWQIGRSNAEDYDDMMRMDLEYVRTASIALDAKIILGTIPAVIRERGEF
jgi:lipopolysaccharide/colanic/teichoic acid biosynthesis glycosyltransferase